MYWDFSEEEWNKRIKQTQSTLSACTMCPRNCGVNRLKNEVGYCGSVVQVLQNGEFSFSLGTITLHLGEEPVLCGNHGVGNLFFTGCNARCLFCQNHEISQREENSDKLCGSDDAKHPEFVLAPNDAKHPEFLPVHNDAKHPEFTSFNSYTTEQLAQEMVALQTRGASSIGLVTPSHVVLFLLPAIKRAKELGLRLPIVYNSNGYDSVKTLQLLEGIVSIYLPDFKYGNDIVAMQLSGLPNYISVAQKTLREMKRQVGSRLIINEDGVASRGLIVRHLVLPDGLAESKAVFEFLSDEIGAGVAVSLMAQYYPAHKALNCTGKLAGMRRLLTREEYERAAKEMQESWLYNGWTQELESEGNYRPEFSNRERPFK